MYVSAGFNILWCFSFFQQFNKIEIEVTMATAGMNIFSERNQMIVDLGCGPNNPPDAIPPQSFLSYTSDKHPRYESII